MCWCYESKRTNDLYFNLLVIEEEVVYFKEDRLTVELHLHTGPYGVPQIVSQSILLGIPPQESVLWPSKLGYVVYAENPQYTLTG